MRRIGVGLVLALFLGLLWAWPAWASTASAPVYASVVQPVSGGTSTLMASTPVVSGDAVNNAVTLSSIQFYVALQPGATVSVVWLDQGGGIVSSDAFGPYPSVYAPSAAMSDYPPAGVYGVKLSVSAPGSSGGLSAVWFGQAVNSQGTATDFPAPTSDQLSSGAVGSGGSGTTSTSDSDGLTLTQILSELNAMSGQLGVIVNDLQVPSTVPSGLGAPVVTSVSPVVPVVSSVVPSGLTDPGGYDESGVVDAGGGAVAVAVPSYTVPAAVAAPVALPVSPDPLAALPAHDAPVPPVAVGSVDASPTPVAVGSRDVLGSVDAVEGVASIGSVSGTMVPDSVMSVQSYSVDSYSADPVRVVDPIP